LNWQPIEKIYEESCKSYKDNFASFRKDKKIISIIPEFAGEKLHESVPLLWSMIKNNKEIYKNRHKFQKNDIIGNPIILEISPKEFYSLSTLRYMVMLGNIIDNFGSLNDMNIIEIGGGYGGLCNCIHQIFTPKSYDSYDLEGVNLLTENYLTHVQELQRYDDELTNRIWNVKCKYIDDVDYDKKYDLVISTSALNEFPEETQDNYFEIIKICNKGYLEGSYKGEAGKPRDDHIIKKLEENKINFTIEENKSWKGHIKTICWNKGTFKL